MLRKAQARKIMLSVPGTVEKPYFNKPSIFFGGEFLVRVHDKEDGVALRVSSMEMRDVMLEAEPNLFYVIEHYRNYPVLLVRLSALDEKTLRQLLLARITQLDEPGNTKYAGRARAKTRAKPPRKGAHSRGAKRTKKD